MPPKAKKNPEGVPAAPTVLPPPTVKGGTAAGVVQRAAKPQRTQTAAVSSPSPTTATLSTHPPVAPSPPSKSSLSNRPPSSLIPSVADAPSTPLPQPQSDRGSSSARCRPFRPKSTARAVSRVDLHRLRHGTDPRPHSIPAIPLHKIPVRTIQIFAPDMLKDAPIRLPSPPRRESTESSLPPDQTAPAGAPSSAALIEQDETTLEKGPIKLREGWGYKIGETKWRAVFDPKRKSIPKLPLRTPEGYSVSSTTGSADSTANPPVYIVVNPIEEPSVDNSQPKTLLPRPKPESFVRKVNRGAAEAVKKCYEERMAEEASSSRSTPSLGALVRIISEETVQLPSEHFYTHPQCVHTAEIVTTFPLDQVAHYKKKKYKDDHVVISSANLEEIYKIISKTRNNKLKWARVKARAAVDEEYRVKQAEKKARNYAAEKAKIAALSVEERKMINIRKYANEKAKRLEKDPLQLAKKQRQEERRLANLAMYKALLEAGIDDPEEKRRIQRRIKSAERTPEERRALNRRDTNYTIKKRERMKNASPEELARHEEEKRLKAEKKAALALLTPKERMRAQQKEYEARYKAKKLAKMEKTSRRQLSSPAKKKRKGKKEREEERGDDVDMIDIGEDHFGFRDQEMDDYEENQLAAQAISSPSPTRPSRSLPPSRHSHSYPHHHDDDVIQIDGPSTSRFNPQQRYGGDIETELIQLQKDVVWSDRAIHNSRVEVNRLRDEAAHLESAIGEELQTQRERKRRIALLQTIWREDHGEDSQG